MGIVRDANLAKQNPGGHWNWGSNNGMMKLVTAKYILPQSPPRYE